MYILKSRKSNDAMITLLMQWKRGKKGRNKQYSFSWESVHPGKGSFSLVCGEY